MEDMGNEDAAIDANDDGANDWDHGDQDDLGWDNPIEQGHYDDDPNPYDGTYSEE